MKRMFFAGCVSAFFLGSSASAQPQLSLSTNVVTAGDSLSVTIAGGPGQFYALVGSSVNSGVTYAGVPLSVGADLAVLSP